MAVYLVGREGADKDELPRIVEARTASSAIAHVARKSFGATVISTRQAMDWAKKGVELESTSDEPEAEAE